MKHIRILLSLLAVGFLGTATLSANTPLLESPDLSSTEPWIAGSNLFDAAGAWQGFVGSAGGDYTVESRVEVNGDMVTFNSYDDGTSDMIESFLFQEFNAGPPESATPTIFSTGDVIVFKGSASATRSGNDTSDMKVRAFIKTLGYNEQGWAFQTKDQYTEFFPLTDTMQDFELRVTYPDITVDDSLQVIQLGFEITTSYDGSAMDSGTITFTNLEGYIEGEGGQDETYLGYTVMQDTPEGPKYINTGDWMGILAVDFAPIIYSYTLGGWISLSEDQDATNGAWVYIFR